MTLYGQNPHRPKSSSHDEKNTPHIHHTQTLQYIKLTCLLSPHSQKAARQQDKKLLM
ncbi:MULTISPECIES: hypothetical protein [unclassified Bartonella]|uniref:hypothetical protein n=1 Tax=unclassified Bartonella TaxID=2645622 RepID=UPI000300BEC7